MSQLKIFGCLAYASTLQANRKKLDPRARKCIFLGFKHGTKGYVLFDLKSRETLVSRHVIFYENIFPYALQNDSSHGNHKYNNVDSVIPVYNDTTFLDLQPVNSIPASPNSNMPIQQPNTVIDPTTQQPNSNPSPDPAFPQPTQQPTHNPQPSQPQQPTLRQSSRARKTPTYLQDYHCTLATSKAAPSHSKIRYPISQVLSYHKLSTSHKHHALTISSTIEPKCYAKAVIHDCWQQAINAELLALEKNHTWSLSLLPDGKHPIGCKWVFKVKHKSDGTVERHKARLVAKGYNQIEGIDYLETFSPVAKMTTIRVLMALASTYNWHLHQLDVNTAFLHGDLHEEVYMKPPPGLQISDPNLVCKLEKSLYGLKQASRQWNAKLTEVLLCSGYIQSRYDYSLFTKSNGSGFTAILVYVDDLALTGTEYETPARYQI